MKNILRGKYQNLFQEKKSKFCMNSNCHVTNPLTKIASLAVEEYGTELF